MNRLLKTAILLNWVSNPVLSGIRLLYHILTALYPKFFSLFGKLLILRKIKCTLDTF